MPAGVEGFGHVPESHASRVLIHDDAHHVKATCLIGPPALEQVACRGTPIKCRLFRARKSDPRMLSTGAVPVLPVAGVRGH